MANKTVPGKRPQPLKRIIQFAIIVGSLAILVVAGMIFYPGWPGGGIDRTTANPNLNPLRRLYLEYYLDSHATELKEPAGRGMEEQLFTIFPGENAATIAGNLQQAGLLNNVELFLNYLTYYDLDGGLVSGDYILNPRQPIPQLTASLGVHGARRLELSFLPGWRSEEMANYLRVVSPAKIDSDTFLALVNAPHRLDLAYFAFLHNLPENASLEGFLFPGTYQLDPATDSAGLIRLMLQRFDEQITPAMRQSFGGQGLSLFEAVTLASIVEKEAIATEEKPLVAAVFLNRLRSGMPLQADPTVQYSLGYNAAAGTWWQSPLSAIDLANDSPYNTYLVHGLPPGPVSNPGLSSMQAVAAPSDVDFLFFVLDCTSPTKDRHMFSTTYDEHLIYVERCR